MRCLNFGIPGWMSKEELVWLHANALNMRSAVEIGSWRGRSTHAILSGCDGTVYAVDHFKGTPSELDTTHAEALCRDIYADFMLNVGHFPNLSVMRMSSMEAAVVFSDAGLRADMVFIDGEHTYNAVMEDVKAWSPLCDKLLCGHDRWIDGVGQALSDMPEIKWRNGAGSIYYAIKGEDF